MGKINSILLVDDDDTNNLLNIRLLKKMSIAETVKITLNGREALDYIDECAFRIGRCPELILLDINMPVMNGFEFLDEYNKLEFANKKDVKIAVLTTSSEANDLGKMLNLGIKHYLNKPLTDEKLNNLLYNLSE